jgi:hypothetical protein
MLGMFQMRSQCPSRFLTKRVSFRNLQRQRSRKMGDLLLGSKRGNAEDWWNATMRRSAETQNDL